MRKHRVQALVLPVIVATGLIVVSPSRAAGPDPQLWAVSAISPDHTADLSGDGLGDVIVQHTTGRQSTVTVRRGYDGHQLWSRTTPNLLKVLPLRLGTPARPGVLFVRGAFNSAGTSYTLHLDAFGGRTGMQLWSWSGTGFVAYTAGGGFAHANIPAFEAALPARSHAARLVVSRESNPDSFTHITVQPIVISGADGSASSPGTAAHGVGFAPAMSSVGDLDGDGYADFGVSGRGLEARSSAPGQTRIWRWPRTPLKDTRVKPIPDATGDGRPEVLIDIFGNDTPDDAVLDGHDGHALFETRSDRLYPAGDVNGDGLSDVIGLHTIGPSSEPPAGMRLTAYVGRSGAVLWRRTLNRAGPEGSVRGGPAGDVQPDQLLDFEAKIDNELATIPSHDYIVSGRDGTMRDGAVLGGALMAPVDARGDDFYQFDDADSDLTVIDGRTRNTVWTVRLKPSGTVGVRSVSAAQLTADLHADVLVLQTGTPGKVLMIDGATHAIRWSASA